MPASPYVAWSETVYRPSNSPSPTEMSLLRIAPGSTFRTGRHGGGDEPAEHVPHLNRPLRRLVHRAFVLESRLKREWRRLREAGTARLSSVNASRASPSTRT